MAFLGNQPAAQFTTIPTVQRFNGTGSATEFTLDRTVASVQSIMVSVDGVIQDTSSYTIPDGVTLTFSSAPSSGTGNIFINYLGLVLGTVTHPSTSSLSATSGTFSTTLAVTGETTLATHLNMGDSDIIKLGDGADLQIFHDGSNSYIKDVGTGNLILACQDFSLTNPAVGENMITAVVDGAVTLYHDNSAKIATTSTGVTSTGTYVGTSAGSASAPNFAITSGALGANGMFVPSANTLGFGSGGTERMRIHSNGVVSASAGVALGVGTANTSSNVLNDYEQGTWTATLTGSTSNPSTAVTVVGTYTKIGNMCYAQFQLSNVNSTGAAGGARITGLPFTASGSQATGNVMTYVRFTLGTGSTNISPYVSGTQIAFYQSTSNGGWSEITHNAGTGAYLSASVFYKTT